MIKKVAFAALALLPLATPAISADRLEVKMFANKSGIHLDNVSGKDLSGCGLKINGKFSAPAFEIKRGGFVKFSYGELMTSADIRMDGTVDTVRDVYVSCSRPVFADAGTS